MAASAPLVAGFCTKVYREVSGDSLPQEEIPQNPADQLDQAISLRL